MNKSIERIKELLSDFTEISDKTKINKDNWVEINYLENPLNPNLLCYCFDVILGFDVRYRIAEKVNYIIEFDYKGTYCRVGHYKLSYRLNIDIHYRTEIIELFSEIKQLLQQAFFEIGKETLGGNKFAMENESPYYYDKFHFYQDRIEKLENRKAIISDKCKGQWVTVKSGERYTCKRPMCQDYINQLTDEITYSIETYIDVFFSCIEHVLILLHPFLDTFNRKTPYMDKIHNPKWTWDKKIEQVCGGRLDSKIEPLRFIKEVYRNRSTHGMFSRELKAYVGIPNFGNYPMYIGKRYLKGFLEDNDDSLTYDKFLEIKDKFNNFFDELDTAFEIPMLFIKSGLPIPVDTERYTKGVDTAEQADDAIAYLWHELDNQNNMDW